MFNWVSEEPESGACVSTYHFVKWFGKYIEVEKGHTTTKWIVQWRQRTQEPRGWRVWEWPHL